MSQSIKNVILIGAGGTLGTHIFDAFDSDKHFTLSVLSRKSSASTFPSHIKVHSVGDDYPEAELLAAFTGQDAVVCAISAYSNAIQKSFIDVAIKAGVKRYVPAEFGCNTMNENARALLPTIFGGKKEINDYLVEKENAGLTWTALATGVFFDWAMDNGFLAYDVAGKKATIWDTGDVKWSATTLATIGLAVKNALLISEKTANKYLGIASFTVTQNEVLAAFEKATGTKWEVERVQSEEKKKVGEEMWGKGDIQGAFILIAYAMFVAGHGCNFPEELGTANELLSLPKEELDDVIAKIVHG